MKAASNFILPMVVSFCMFSLICSDSIDLVSRTSTIVSTNSTVSVNLTLSSSASSITFGMPRSFTQFTSGCLVNSSASPCAINTSTNQTNLTFTGSLASGKWVFQFMTTNPYYQTNFEMIIYKGTGVMGVSNITSGIVVQQPTCSLSSSSTVVGATATATFTVSSLNFVPSGSLVFLYFQNQTSSGFPQIVGSPDFVSCSSASSSASCSNTGQNELSFQVLGLFPSNVTRQTTTFTFSNITNPAFNTSFGSVSLIVTDSGVRKIASCSVTRPTPTTLSTGTFSNDNGWQSNINAVSTALCQIVYRVFIPSNFYLMIIYPLGMSITADAPASSSSFSNSTNNILRVSGLTTTTVTSTTRASSFSLTITNPAVVRALPIAIYTMFNSTCFIDMISVNSFVLTPSLLSLTASLGSNSVMTNNTLLTIVGLFSDPVSSGTLTITINTGTFNCTTAPKLNGISSTYSSCSTQTVTLAVTALSGSASIVLGYTTPLSVQVATVTAFTVSSASEAISSGNTTVYFKQSSISFSVINSNLMLGKNTTINIKQQANPYIVSQRRMFLIGVPSNMFFNNVQVTGAGFTSATINSTNYSLLVDYNGLLDINITGIQNPSLYNGSKLWTITTTDPSSTPSLSIGVGAANQSQQYIPATSSFTISMSSNTIQNSLNVTLFLVETLSHYTSSTIIIKMPSVTIVTPCLNISTCQLLSDGSISLPFQSRLQFSSSIILPAKPGNYYATIQIFTNSTNGKLLVQNASYSYIVLPMSYSASVLFNGFVGQSGTLDVNFTKRPTTNLTISHNSTIFQSVSCINCTSSRLQIGGIVSYFTSATILIQGQSGGVVYASTVIVVDYPCLGGCQVCSSTTCTQCFNSTYTPNTYLYSGYCLSSCPISTYSAGSTCVSCSSNCAICPSGVCTQCVSSYYLYEKNCLSACPDGLIPLNGQCQLQPILCGKNCAKCVSSTICTTCQTNYYLYSNYCYDTCPNKTIAADGACTPAPIPPQESSHLPFPFVIASSILLILLVFFKFFDKRSLVLGNYIAFSSLFQLGALCMFLSYLFFDTSSLLAQTLCFAVLLAKLAANIFFLIYFIKKLAIDPHYQKWLSQNKSHQNIKTSIMCISVITSFQTFRLIYSRLLGLEIFFGRFSSPQILKPLAYLNYAYFVVCSCSSIALAVYSLYKQNTVHTSLFYSSIEIIIIQCLLFLACLLDDHNKSDFEFQYQRYKIGNEFSSDSISALPGNNGDQPPQGNFPDKITINHHPDSEVDTLDKQEQGSETELKNLHEDLTDREPDDNRATGVDFNIFDRETYKQKSLVGHSRLPETNSNDVQIKIEGDLQEKEEFYEDVGAGDQNIPNPLNPNDSLNQIPGMQSESEDNAEILQERSDGNNKKQQGNMTQSQLQEVRKRRLQSIQKQISSRSSRKSLFRRKIIDQWREIKDAESRMKMEQYRQKHRSTESKPPTPTKSQVAVSIMTRSMIQKTTQNLRRGDPESPYKQVKPVTETKQELISSLRKSQKLFNSGRLTRSISSNKVQVSEQLNLTQIRKQFMEQRDRQRQQQLDQADLRRPKHIKEQTQFIEIPRPSTTNIPCPNTQPAYLQEQDEKEFTLQADNRSPNKNWQDSQINPGGQELLADSASDHYRQTNNLPKTHLHMSNDYQNDKSDDQDIRIDNDFIQENSNDPNEQNQQALRESPRLDVYEQANIGGGLSKRKRKKKKRTQHHNSMTEAIYLQRLQAPNGNKRSTRGSYYDQF